MDITSQETFGELLRRYRGASGMIQEELAERAGLSARAISDLERGAKQRPHRDTVQLLCAALGLNNQQAGEFAALARGSASANLRFQEPLELPETTAQPKTNLPYQSSSFIGREHELAQLSAQLRRANVRLLTISGAGGSGKTRLAQELAARFTEDFADGVYFVDLAPLGDPQLVADEIAATLGVQQGSARTIVDSLQDYLRDKGMLLVLDNFEHLLSGATVVSRLLGAVGRLKVLATSREALRLRGEREYPLGPLALPAAGEVEPERLGEVEAVRLYVERAGQVAPEFALSEDNAAMVTAIVRRLDGLPLAIELAAARAKLLPPATMLGRLERSLDLLTGGARDLPARQRTLRATIEWSYGLLSEPEQALFRRLAVFRGGRTLAAISAVCGGDDESSILDAVAALVDKGLLRQAEGATYEARLVMLETIHEFAREKLAASGEGAGFERRHALYFVKLAAAAEPHLSGPQQAEWMTRLEAEHDNFRVALEWALQDGTVDGAERRELGLQLAGSLGWLWRWRGHVSEGRRWLAALLEHDAGDVKNEQPGAARALALRVAAELAWDQDDYALAEDYFSRSIAISRAREDKPALALVLNSWGLYLTQAERDAEGRALLAEALQHARESAFKPGIAVVLTSIVSRDWQFLDHATIGELLQESLQLSRELGNKLGIAFALTLLAYWHHQAGDEIVARAYREQALALHREIGNRPGAAMLLAQLGEACWLQGDFKTSRSYHEQSLNISQEIGHKIDIGNQLGNLGVALYSLGEYGRARELARAGLQILCELGWDYNVAGSLVVVATIELMYVLSASQPAPPTAAPAIVASALSSAKLIGAALEIWPGSPQDPFTQRLIEQTAGRCRTLLGAEQYDQAVREGATLSKAAAVSYALAMCGAQG